MDHPWDAEGLNEITWADRERGFEHHFAVLLPHLTATARREFQAALLRASAGIAAVEAQANQA